MFALIAAFSFTSQSLAAVDKYAFQPTEETISFFYAFDGRRIKGAFPTFEGNLDIDFKAVEKSSVDVTITTTDAKGGFVFATQTLRGPNMLWVKKFPEMKFQSTSFKKKGKGAEVEGMLTVKDITKPVTLTVTLFRPQGRDDGDNSVLDFLATTTISLSEFDSNAYPNLVDDALDIEIRSRIIQE